MGGWIKLEKDLREDPRLKRLARSLTEQCNAPALQAVTLALGALAQLWMYADTFARDDDTLDIGADEVNQLTGIDGFCQLIPRDWLEVLEAHRVKLPGFHTHNSTDAKRRALTQKRVTAYRKRRSVTNGSGDVTQGRHQTETETLDQDLIKTPPTPSQERGGAEPKGRNGKRARNRERLRSLVDGLK